tara:strand:- start:179 stop:331 length:153 start_codon:yes stop_codon:yes gene_type:complete
MIPKIIDLLQSNDFHGVSENVEIAKGKHELVKTFNGAKLKLKRQWLQLRK